MTIVLGKAVHASPVGSSFKHSPKRRTGTGTRKTLDLRKKIGSWDYRGVRLIVGWEEGAILKIEFNSGAGRIGGATAFLALWCSGRTSNHGDMYIRFPVQAGITRNANRVPYEY